METLSGRVRSAEVGKPFRYVGARRRRLAWAWAGHRSLSQTNACKTRNPSAKICAPGCPSPVRPQNPTSIATRMLAWKTVSFSLDS